MVCNTRFTAPTKLDFYYKVVGITSAIAPPSSQLTPMEQATLAHFLALPKEHTFYPFSPKARRIVLSQSKENITPQLLSSRIASLVEKRYLVRDEDNFLDFSPHLRKLRELTTFNVSLKYIQSDTADSAGDQLTTFTGGEDDPGDVPVHS